MNTSNLAIFSLLLIFSASSSFAQSKKELAAKKEEDAKAIKSMCGCYNISFNYSEVFPTDTGYKLHEPYNAEAPAEWVFVVEENEDKIVLQHLLIVGEDIIIKHWRQDWIYEDVNHHIYHKNNTWKYENAKVKSGQWTQKVYQVDDSPRYTGSGTWVHVDDKHYWENTTPAPLPRREYSKRSDYNVLIRTNKHLLTDYGWLHEQDNDKVIRAKKDSTIVSEKGLNKYYKIDDIKCKDAIKWWENNKEYWALVRAEWDKIYDKKEDLTLKKVVDESKLWESLFALGEKQRENSKSNPKLVTENIHNLIEMFISKEPLKEDSGY